MRWDTEEVMGGEEGGCVCVCEKDDERTGGKGKEEMEEVERGIGRYVIVERNVYLRPFQSKRHVANALI